MLKCHKYSSSSQFEEGKNSVLFRETLQSPFLLKMIHRECDSQNLQIRVVYEFIEDSIRTESLSKQNVFALTDNLLSALSYLHRKQLVHGDVRPCFIGFCQKSGCFKLMDRLGCKKNTEETQKINIEQYKPLYMAPKLFNGLISGQKKIQHKLFKSEVFTLGMIILEILIG